MKIIKRGQNHPDDNVRYWGECSKCGCEIEAETHETNIVVLPYYPEYRIAECPNQNCRSTIYVCEYEYLQKK